jgi:Na+/phosphate symporter
MNVRLLQTMVAAGNCLFGLLLLAIYGPALLHSQAWPPSLGQQVLVLVAGSALPLAVLAVRFPVVGGMAQFSAAYIGNQLLHEAPLRVLREFSCVSMGIALAILFLAVFRGILEITQEAFGEAEDSDEQHVMRAA